MPRERLKPSKLPPSPKFERVWPPETRDAPAPKPPRKYVKGATGPVERLKPSKRRRGRG